jgi:hypothetical protein
MTQKKKSKRQTEPIGSEVEADATRKGGPRYHGQGWDAAVYDEAAPVHKPPAPIDAEAESVADDEERKEQRELQRERDGGHTRPPESVGSGTGGNRG